MHTRIAEALFRAGARARNPSLFGEYERLKKSEWHRAEALAEIQLERASRFLTFAARYSRYYRGVFAEAGFDPSRLTSVADLRIVPPVEKATLIQRNREIHTDYDFKGFLAETSGTTGSALEFRKSELWDSTNRAHLMRAYDWYDVKPWHRNGYLWGYNVDPRRAAKVRALDVLQNRFRLFAFDAPAVRAFARRLRSAEYVGGYSSMIYEVARVVNELDLERPSLRLVKGTSEMILDVYHEASRAAFGRKVTSEYGAAESGLIAFECPSGSMHVNVEDVIVEIDDDGGILVTNLVSHSFPIVRYRLGDAVRLSSGTCPCGRAHPVISEIVGRKGAKVVGRTGSYPALTFYYVFKNLALSSSILLNYKAVQTTPGEVLLHIEGPENRKYEPDVRKELQKYFGSDVEVECRFVDAFDRSRAKAQYFESQL